MIRAVIFDFDGTLVEPKKNSPLVLLGYQRFLQENDLVFSVQSIQNAHKVAEARWDSFKERQKRPTTFCFEKWFLSALAVKPTLKLSRALHNRWINYREKNTKLIPWSKKILKELTKKGVRIGVITNTSDNSNQIIAKHLEINKYIEYFLMSHKEGTIKSELKIFHKMLNLFNEGNKNKIKPRECLMVGNNLNEDTAANKIGMKTAILTRRLELNRNRIHFEPNHYIKSLIEITKIIEKS